MLVITGDLSGEKIRVVYPQRRSCGVDGIKITSLRKMVVFLLFLEFIVKQ